MELIPASQALAWWSSILATVTRSSSDAMASFAGVKGGWSEVTCSAKEAPPRLCDRSVPSVERLERGHQCASDQTEGFMEERNSGAAVRLDHRWTIRQNSWSCWKGWLAWYGSMHRCGVPVWQSHAAHHDYPPATTGVICKGLQGRDPPPTVRYFSACTLVPLPIRPRLPDVGNLGRERFRRCVSDWQTGSVVPRHRGEFLLPTANRIPTDLLLFLVAVSFIFETLTHVRRRASVGLHNKSKSAIIAPPCPSRVSSWASMWYLA